MSAQEQQRSGPGFLTVLRDVTSYVFGIALIAYQAVMVPPKDVNEAFLLLGGALVGVPGAWELLASRARAGGSPTTTGSPPTSPQEQAPRL